MRMKKCLSILLAVVMIATMITSLPITANAVEIEAAATAVNKTFEIKKADDLNPALTEINTATEESKFVIDLQIDLTNCGISISNSKAEVTIIGNGHSIQAPSQVVYVEKGATVNLGDGQSELIIMGYNESHTTAPGNDDPGLVYVLQDSTCNMNDKVTLKNHKGNNYLGGGVSVQGGTFNMKGGTIQNCGIDGGSVCYGGGVAVYNGGHFTMTGGTIDHCYAITTYIEDDPLYQNCYSGIGGGVFVTDGSEFIMNGGTISNNTATNFGGGVAMTLSDVETIIDPETGKEKINPETGKGYVDLGNPRSNVTINGGLISKNNAKYGAGVFASGLIFAFAKAFSKLPLESGTPENPGLYINRGENKSIEISSNTASDTGGGVLAIGLKAPKRVDIKNTDISSNHAKSGAGISVYYYWTKAMIENCHIHDNTASTLGGGIYLEDNKDLGAGTTIKNTVIENNTAGEKGGGIYYKKESVLNIEGADTIQNNTVGGKDNNLYFQGTDYPVNVTGSLEGSRIGVTDAKLFEDNLDDYDPEAQSSLSLTEGFKTQNPSLVPENAFTSDHESWVVDYGEIATKTIASEDDFYTYSAQRYTVKSRSDSGESCRGEIYSVKANTFTSGVAENPDVFKQEVLSRFSDTSKYRLEYSDSEWHDYTKLDTGEPVSVYFRNIYNAYIYINPNSNYSNPRLITSTGHQTQYAESGTFVYQYYTANSDTIEYSDEFEPIEFYYDELLDSDMIIYDYDEFGHIISQTVVNKTPVKTPHQETIIELRYDKEVRLVRKKPDYHINNEDIIKASYDDNNETTNDDIFTDEVEVAIGKEIKVGDTIGSFFLIPKVAPTATNTCPYIFKGWYYDQNNENDAHPVQFGTDKYAKDIYAHWIKVDDVTKDDEDTHILPGGGSTYGGFDLAGVQTRLERTIDPNYDYARMPGGMRFITSLSKKVVNEINALDDKTDIEYGFVTTTDKNKAWINYHEGSGRKLQYVSKTANGINTLDPEGNDTYFDFAKNINCTSKQSNSAGVVKWDHCNFDNYLLYTLVVTYEEEGADKGKNVLARPYIHYTDANGLERVAYSDYNGKSKKLGGCYTNYEELTEQEAKA